MSSLNSKDKTIEGGRANGWKDYLLEFAIAAGVCLLLIGTMSHGLGVQVTVENMTPAEQEELINDMKNAVTIMVVAVVSVCAIITFLPWGIRKLRKKHF